MALLKRKRIGLNDAMSVVTRFVNACNRHDADGVGACLHPDFDSIQPMYPTRNFRGADQVRRNWQAIFDAEPGFRLTVLRSAAHDDTVWLELHGAGRDAEVAGVFVMGIQGDRIRWARIYSALVEPVPAGTEPAPAPAPLHEVRAPGDSAAAGAGGVVEEGLIAPVLDIERSGRRRRRRRGVEAAGEDGAAPVSAEAPGAGGGDEPAPAEAEAEPVAAEAVVAAGDSEAVAIVEMVEVEPEIVVVVPEPEPEETGEAAAGDAVGAEADAEPPADGMVTEAADGAEPVEPAVDDGGPPTEAVEMVTLTDPEPASEPEPEPEPEAVAPPPFTPEAPRRRFGKRSRS